LQTSGGPVEKKFALEKKGGGDIPSAVSSAGGLKKGKFGFRGKCDGGSLLRENWQNGVGGGGGGGGWAERGGRLGLWLGGAQHIKRHGGRGGDQTKRGGRNRRFLEVMAKSSVRGIKEKTGEGGGGGGKGGGLKKIGGGALRFRVQLEEDSTAMGLKVGGERGKMLGSGGGKKVKSETDGLELEGCITEKKR